MAALSMILKICFKNYIKFPVRILLFYGAVMMETELILGLQDRKLISGWCDPFVLKVSVHCMCNVYFFFYFSFFCTDCKSNVMSFKVKQVGYG